MKKVFLLIALFIACFCNAQNYQCLQSGVKHYFINGNGYLRGIRIDSVRTMGDTTVYYPFHTPRGSYDITAYILPVFADSGSWLGKRVLQLSDGTFIFDSYWDDSVIIKTKANIGDSWVFYKDTSRLYYRATVVSTDTMTVLSSLDSVKTIMITANNDSGIVTSDPVDSFNIILSKNNGFVQVFDLYTFPYHMPDTAYRPGLDFFLDRSTCILSTINNPGGNPPDKNVTVFNLVDFINPNNQQLHNWNIGDVIESFNSIGIPIYTTPVYTQLLDTIVDKTVSGHYVNYTVSGSTCSCPAFYPCSLICEAGGYSFSDLDYTVIDTFEMPEESVGIIGINYIFYYPFDTSHCSNSPAYLSILPHYNTGLGWEFEYTSYKLGIGKTYFDHADGNPTYESDGLLYYNINGISCGTPLDTPIDSPNLINNINEQNNYISLYPNPVKNELTITSSTTITQITITNLLGQTVFTKEYNTDKAIIDVAGLPPGVYLVKINGAEVRKFVKE